MLWPSVAVLFVLLYLVCISWKEKAALRARIATQELETAVLRNQYNDLQSQVADRCENTTSGSAAAYAGAVAALLRGWEDRYGLRAVLSAGATWHEPAPEKATVRRAPHLQDCRRLEDERRRLESRGANGTSPPWALQGPPLPPWISGREEDNLPQTRAAQTAIWRHQNPPDCRAPGLRFLLASWPAPPNHGLGSALHIMTLWLAAAVGTGRILVTRPDFVRSRHEGCPGWVHGRLECYFFPLAPRECTERALGLHDGRAVHGSVLMKALRGRSKRVVAAPQKSWGFVQKVVPGTWGAPWLEVQSSVELWGRMLNMSEGDLHLGWWKAQGIRYMLRWPTEYLCALTNKARHESYGEAVASELVRSAARQSSYVALDDGSRMAPLPERRIWDNTDALDASVWRHETDAYVPRPIVNMHVRQGDKAREMKLYSLASYMVLAEKLRSHVPNMHHIWLSTEMQSVIDESSAYPSWTILYTRVPRMRGQEGMAEFEQTAGVRTSVENAFVNLLISVECDYFVGPLGSNWPRIINELRLTNGRQRRGYITTTKWKEIY